LDVIAVSTLLYHDHLPIDHSRLDASPAPGARLRAVRPPLDSVARALLTTLPLYLPAWQFAALDLTLVFDKSCSDGVSHTHAIVGNLDGVAVALVPLDASGGNWSIDLSAPFAGRTDVPLAELAGTLATTMLTIHDTLGLGAYPPVGSLPHPDWYADARALRRSYAQHAG